MAIVFGSPEAESIVARDKLRTKAEYQRQGWHASGHERLHPDRKKTCGGCRFAQTVVLGTGTGLECQVLSPMSGVPVKKGWQACERWTKPVGSESEDDAYSRSEGEVSWA